MELTTVEAAQSIMLGLITMSQAPTWFVLKRILDNQSKQDAYLMDVTSRLAYIEGRDDKLLRGL